MPDLPTPNFYTLTMFTGIVISIVYWSRVARRDPRLVVIYISALFSSFLGAKLVYLASEGWLFTDSEDRLLHWMAGKSITGALLGGFLGVEIAKRIIGYSQATGDRFALVIPIVVTVGRIGCLTQGCCQGVECDFLQLGRWPAVPVEMLFNLIALLTISHLRRGRLLSGQHFHLYLIAYGLFRFAHEFMRATQKPFFNTISGYQIAAIFMVAVGIVGFWIRAKSTPPRETSSPE